MSSLAAWHLAVAAGQWAVQPSSKWRAGSSRQGCVCCRAELNDRARGALQPSLITCPAAAPALPCFYCCRPFVRPRPCQPVLAQQAGAAVVASWPGVQVRAFGRAASAFHASKLMRRPPNLRVAPFAPLACLYCLQVGERFNCLAMTLEQPFKDNANLPDPEQVGAGTMGSPCTACTAAGAGTGCWLLVLAFPTPAQDNAEQPMQNRQGR